MTQNFVATYSYVPPFDRLFRRSRLTEGWTLSGTTRFSTGFPVTLSDDSDRSLLGTLGNGVNNELLDTPEMPERLGQFGNAARRFFYGPGIENFDMQLSKTVPLAESKSLDIRIEAFNVFNRAQFYGPSAVDGEINDPSFGQVVSAAAPRLMQAAVKFHF
jgi:hypothetical protein